ncbi:MAG: PilN domain-containing protein [Candidatus Omnitrophota bacterium]
MNTLGIYFGPQIISVVETKNNFLIKNTQIASSLISPANPSEEKVPEEIKLVTLLKDELTKNAIEAKEAVVSLSGKDLIIRTFEIPIIPHSEIYSAVNFEVKKYIPFKTTDLIADCQWQFDRTIRKTRILYVGIKKDSLNKYIAVFKQLGIKVISIEYSAFSMLRLLNLAGVKEKKIIAMVNIEAGKDDEANFVVLENGFPLFSRDITFTGGYDEAEKTEEGQPGVFSGKLKREIQISLDYYERKFPGKSISKIFFVTNPGYHADLEGFFKESNLAVKFIDVTLFTGKPVPFSLAFAKGYSSSLYKVKTELKINLVSAKERTEKKVIAEKKGLAAIVALFRANTQLIAAGLFICLATFFFGMYRTLPVQKDLEKTIIMRPPISTVSADRSYADLAAVNSNYKLKIETMGSVVNKREYLTPLLDVLPRLIPQGMWLTKLSFSEEKEKIDLVLKGTVYMENRNKELGSINALITDLKRNNTFYLYFKEINLVSTEIEKIKGVDVTNFVISCQGAREAK